MLLGSDVKGGAKKKGEMERKEGREGRGRKEVERRMDEQRGERGGVHTLREASGRPHRCSCRWDHRQQ